MSTMFFTQRLTSEKISLIDSIRRHKKLGYTKLDLNLCSMGRGESEFNTDNWRTLAIEARNEADKLGVSFCQGHLPFRSEKFDSNNNNMVNKLEQDTLRAIEVSAIMGVPWTVVHPVHNDSYPAEAYEEQIEENKKTYQKVVELAGSRNVGLAFENVSDFRFKRRFASTANELIALIEDYSSTGIMACWDFGHANLTYGPQQTYAIKRIGKYLRALHFADNFGERDDHVAPFLGQIKWEEIMKALHDVDYKGAIVLEVMQNNNMPDSLKNASMNFLTEICKYLSDLYYSH